MISRKYLDLMLVYVLVLLAALVVIVNAPPLLRTLFVLPLLFVLPGYTLVSALFPEGQLERVVRIAVTIALSFAITAIGGLILHFTPWGLRTESWLLLLVGVTVAGNTAALARRIRAATPAAMSAVSTLKLNGAQYVMLGLAGIFAFVAFTVARSGASNQPRPGFSQLWVLPVATLEETPQSIQLGIRNEEQVSTQYTLTITSDDIVVETWEAVTLASGAEWEQTWKLPQTALAAGRIEVQLYRDTAPGIVYRQVSLVLNTASQAVQG